MYDLTLDEIAEIRKSTASWAHNSNRYDASRICVCAPDLCAMAERTLQAEAELVRAKAAAEALVALKAHCLTLRPDFDFDKWEGEQQELISVAYRAADAYVKGKETDG